MVKTAVRVGLLWHSLRSDNLGVGALTISQVKIINEAAKEVGCEVNYRVWGTQGGKDYSELLGAQLESIGDVSLRQIATGKSTIAVEMSDCDIIFDIGEGDSFSDIYGTKRFILHIISKLMALRSCSLVLSPQTIGPYSWWGTRLLAKMIMKRCSKVFARDDLSKDYLASIGVLDNTDVAIDVAFALPYERTNLPGDKVKVGVNISGLLYNGGYSGKNMFGLRFNYADFTKRLLGMLTSRDDCQVYLVPHVSCEMYPVDDDYRVCVELQNQFPRTIVAPSFANPIEAKSYISAFDFFTGPRMHACIAAYSSGVPVVPISYSRKFNGLFNSLGYSYLADPIAQSESAVLELIASSLDNRAELKLALDKGNQIAEKKLTGYRNFVREVLDSLLKSQSSKLHFPTK